MNPNLARTGRAGRVRWLLVASISIVGAISFLDRVNISVAGALIARQFRLNDTQLGTVFAGFPLGYMLLQIPGGWLADRFGPRRVLAFGALWSAAFTSLTASVPSGIAGALVALWSVRFLLGVGEAVIYPSSNRWEASWIPSRERGLANGIIFAGVGTGAAFAPPIITAITLRAGWQASFHFCALLGVATGLAWWWLARDRPQDHRWVGAPELDLIERGLVHAAGDANSSSTANLAANGARLPWRVILTSKSVWSLTFSYFCFGYTAFIFFSWFFIYLTRERGLNLKAGAFYASVPLVAMAAGSAGGGLIADAISRRAGRWWGRCGIGFVGLGLAAIFVALGSAVHAASSAALVLAGGAGALYLSQSSYWAVSADLGGSSSGTLSGLMNMGAQLGGAVTAAFTPVIAGRLGWRASFLAAAGLCALGALTWLAVRPDRALADVPFHVQRSHS
jgi:MFS transporter, ACS family, glucarate transporter